MMQDAASTSILLLADASANWRVAGLRQLDRLALATNELGLTSATRVSLHVFWIGNPPAAEQWFPRTAGLTHCAVVAETSMPDGEFDAALTTRLFVGRGAALPKLLAALRQTAATRTVGPADVAIFLAQFATRVRAFQRDDIRYLDGETHINEATDAFLFTLGKTQDGFISRNVNRRVSRFITRWLLPTRITPSIWTLSTFALAVVGCLCLADGSYTAQLTGALFFQIHSVLDGCDGELARAKYLESLRGKWLDTWTDTLATALLAFGTGVGLFHAVNGQSITLAEGVVCSILVVVNEIFALSQPPAAEPAAESITYAQHHHIVRGAGASLLGDGLMDVVVQSTKRDVAYVWFLVLVACGRADWFLHAMTFFMVARLAVTLRANRIEPATDPI